MNKFRYLIWIILLLSINSSFLMSQENMYSFFGKDFIFLENIEKKIDFARQRKDVKSLCAYSALIFYAENLTSKKYKYLEALTLLREATLIAWTSEDIKDLEIVERLWASKICGPNDHMGAEEISKYIKKIIANRKNKKNPETFDPNQNEPKEENTGKNPPKMDAQAFLIAEEMARLDALEQLAERIFGVMVNSVTEVKDFSAKKDVVVTQLKSSLIAGVQFGEAKAKDYEVRIPVSIKKDWIISSIERALLSKNKKLSAEEKDKLYKELEDEYKVVGVGFVDK